MTNTMTNKDEGKRLGLTTDEKEQLISLLDKIKANHCKNYDDRRFDLNCTSKLDNKVCTIEYETRQETDGQECSGCFYCPVFIIRDVLDGEED